uniref:CUB domain-containing protein n=1 Tax=Macrostomum lignano TaxID=282301 RepID=A0A1I8J8X4_9PLAT
MQSFLTPLVLLLLVVYLAIGLQAKPGEGDLGDAPAGVADHRKPPRILDFKVYGLYKWLSWSAPLRELTGEQVVSGNFYLELLYNGEDLGSKPDPAGNDQLSIKLPDLGSNLLDVTDVLILFKSEHLDNKSLTCSFPLARMGKNLCNFTTVNKYIALVVRERIRLHSCRQSSNLRGADGTFSCSLAYDEECSVSTSPKVSLSSCAMTSASHRPWWMAQTDRSFQFERIELHSAAEFNQWTKNFQLSVENSICVNGKNGNLFVRKSFNCEATGSWVMVTALDSDVRLTICQMVAHGSPGGCGEISKPQADSDDDKDDSTAGSNGQACQRTLRSHLGQGRAAYPGGLNCQWTLAPPHRSAKLLLQFPEFSTAGPQDYVAVYEGASVGGKLLGKFYGKAGGKTAPPSYSEPSVFGAKNYLMSGSTSNAVTVQFVTARVANGKKPLPRSTDKYGGFLIKFTIVKDDEYLDNGKRSDFSDPLRKCNLPSYAEKLYTLCYNRGRINPIYLYGNETGGKMLQAYVSSNGKIPLPPINIELMGEKLGVTLFRVPEIEADLTDAKVGSWCRAYKKPEVPPRYFSECCCRYCSLRYLSRYCMWDYSGTSDCALTTNRTGLVFSPPH